MMMMMMMMMMIFTLKHWEGILDFGIFNKIHPFSIPLLDLWNFGIRHAMGSDIRCNLQSQKISRQIYFVSTSPSCVFCVFPETTKVIRI